MADYRSAFRARDPIIQHDINLARIQLNDSQPTPPLQTLSDHPRARHFTKIDGRWLYYEWEEQHRFLNLLMIIDSRQPVITHIDCLDATWTPESANMEMERFGCDSTREEGLEILTRLVTTPPQASRTLATREVDGETFFETPLGHWVRETQGGIQIYEYGRGPSHAITNIRVLRRPPVSNAEEHESYFERIRELGEEFHQARTNRSSEAIRFVGEGYYRISTTSHAYLHQCSDGTIKEYNPNAGRLTVYKPVPAHPSVMISHRVAAIHGYNKGEFERLRQLAF